jgi:hypothetical protein
VGYGRPVVGFIKADEEGWKGVNAYPPELVTARMMSEPLVVSATEAHVTCPLRFSPPFHTELRGGPCGGDKSQTEITPST